MKKILFIIPAFNQGGTNVALLNMMHVIDKHRYHIDFFVIDHTGTIKHRFRDFNVLPASPFLKIFRKSCSDILSFKNLKNNGIINFINEIITKLYIKFILKNNYSKVLSIVAKKITSKQYDTVIGFQEGEATELASYVKALKKIAWIHCDYSKYIEISKRNEEDIYDKINVIVAVSEYTANVFKSFLPTISNKVVAIHNIMNVNDIINKSTLTINDYDIDKDKDKFILVSVGRLVPVKGFNRIPIIASELKKNKIPFVWYIIGGGNEEYKSALALSIKHYDVEKEVILLGEKSNPYQYMIQANVIVCTSISEACPNVINEAKILKRPVITTNFPSAKELITDKKNGYIESIENIANVIKMLYFNRIKYNEILKNLDSYQYDNQVLIKKIERILDEG